MDEHPTPRLRSQDLIYYWNHCWYCSVELDHDYKQLPQKNRHPGKHGFTRDHLIPQSKGGRVIVPACYACNTMKGALSLEEFRIVFFGGHLGKFGGEIKEEELRAAGVTPHGRYSSPLRNFAIERAMERYLANQRKKYLDKAKTAQNPI